MPILILRFLLKFNLGDNGHSQRNGHSKAPRTGGRGENGQYHKRAAYDNRGHSRGGGSKA